MGIEWKDAYKIGQTDIDEQHQRLFELSNAVSAATDQPTVRQLLMQLYKHTREHFELEEALMREFNYPDSIAHTSLHNSLLAKLNAVSQDVGQGKVDKVAIEKLMTDWVLCHILQDDIKIADFVRRQA